MLPEPNFPVKPGEFIGRHAHIDIFAEALRQSTITGRMASFAVLGDWGIGKSSLLLKLAATCSEPNFRMLPRETVVAVALASPVCIQFGQLSGPRSCLALPQG